MVRDYEMMYIVRPELDDEAVQASVESVAALITAQGGEVLKTTMWGKRRLAYEVAHLRDGHYVIAKIKLDTTKVVNLERALAIHDTVFRHLLVSDEIGVDENDLDSTEVVATADDEAVDAELAATPAVSDDDDDLEPVAVGADDDEEEN